MILYRSTSLNKQGTVASEPTEELKIYMKAKYAMTLRPKYIMILIDLTHMFSLDAVEYPVLVQY